jgi:hypothetical protein
LDFGMSNMGRWRGLAALVVDAVTHGSTAIERIQKETAARPFWVLEQIEPIAPATRVVHTLFDVSVSGVHEVVRIVARGVGTAVDVSLGLVEASEQERPPDPPG